MPRTGRPPLNPFMRFWRYVSRDGPIHPVYGQCWVWTGSLLNGVIKGHNWKHLPR
jgi:hypothetical protein